MIYSLVYMTEWEKYQMQYYPAILNQDINRDLSQKEWLLVFLPQKINEQLSHNITTFRQLIAVRMCPWQKPPAGFGLLGQGPAWLWNGIQPAGYRWKFSALIHSVRFLMWCSQWVRPSVTLRTLHDTLIVSLMMCSLRPCKTAVMHHAWCQYVKDTWLKSSYCSYPHICSL